MVHHFVNSAIKKNEKTKKRDFIIVTLREVKFNLGIANRENDLGVIYYFGKMMGKILLMENRFQ